MITPEASKETEISPYLFHSHQWLDVIHRGFGAKSYFTDSDNSASHDGQPISVFPAGPLRIGYLGFPQTGHDDISVVETKVKQLITNGFPAKMHALRFSTGQPLQSLARSAISSVAQPETSIPDLQKWRAENFSKLRRITNRAKKSTLVVTDAATLANADEMFELYANTVQRHSGTVRYTRPYFRALVELSLRHPGVRCLLAMQGNFVAGFHIIANHNGVAYYLHGGMDHEFKQFYPSDLLFLTGIEWARSIGITQYNMLTSPTDQPALVRYKEKWGGRTSPLITHTLNLSPTTMHVFNHLLVPMHRQYCRTKNWFHR